MIDVFDYFAQTICAACTFDCHSQTCPFQNYFDELDAKCNDINRDANYLFDIVKDYKAPDEDNDECFDSIHDWKTEEELDPWSICNTRQFLAS